MQEVSSTHTIHKHLIVQSQQGDQAAMSSLYGLYAKAMYNICRRMMGDEEEAKIYCKNHLLMHFKSYPRFER